MTETKDQLTPEERADFEALFKADYDSAARRERCRAALARLAPEPVKPVVRIGELSQLWRDTAHVDYTAHCRCARQLDEAVDGVDVEAVAKAIQREQYTGEGHPAYPWEKCDQEFWRRRARFAITAILGVKP